MAKKAATGILSRFTLADQACKPRLIWAGYGETGSGRSHFALGAPGPIAIQSFDLGLEGTVEKFKDIKRVHFQDYEWAPTDELGQEEAIKIRDQFIQDFEDLLEMNDDDLKTIIWDRETDIWEMFRYAEFGVPSGAPLNYPKLNQRYRKYINMVKATNKNFGCIQGMKPVWASVPKKDKNGVIVGDKGVDTGTRKRAGFDELEALVHTNIHHIRENGVFKIEVGKSRGPASDVVQDQEFESLSFVDFAQMLFPDTEDSDWE